MINRKSALTLLATTAALSVSATASAAHPELLVKPQTAIPTIISSIIMFLLLVFLLRRTAWGLVLKGLNDREVKIRTEIESAENARRQANSALDEYQKELAKARAEAGEMISQARHDAKKVADELRAQNEAELAAMKERAKQEIESAKRAAISELYNETAEIATTIAAKILDREIKQADHAKLVDDSLAELDTLRTRSN